MAAVPLGVVGGRAAAEKEKARRPLLPPLPQLLPLPASGEGAGWRRGRRPVPRCSLQAWSRARSSSVAAVAVSVCLSGWMGLLY